MTDGQYVYVVATQLPSENVSTPWVAGDDQDETARLAFNSVLQVRLSQHPSLWTTFYQFNRQLLHTRNDSTLIFKGCDIWMKS